MQFLTTVANLMLNTLLGLIVMLAIMAVIDLVQFMTGRKYLLVKAYDFFTEWEYQCRHDHTTIVESVVACCGAWALCWAVLP